MTALLLLVATLGGCASWAPLGTPLTSVDPQHGYRLATAVAPHTGDELLLVAAFSGGGMRAAALAHGVLQRLAATRYGQAAPHRALLDELDVISGVSGGAVTAAYFALDRARYFRQFESRFLNRNVSREMWQALLNPATFIRLMSHRYGRGDLYAEVLDRRLFDGATFADFGVARSAPFVILNATDLSVGARFEFTQDRFDAICSDLSRYPVARAVAASAAAPPAVSPLAMRNNAGQCGYRLPPWVAAAAASGSDIAGIAARRRLLARELIAYQQAARYPYLHLADGSLADDLGVRALIDAMISPVAPPESVRPAATRRIVLIAVNASADSGPTIARRRAAPRELETTRRAAQVTFDRYSIESTLLLRSLVNELAQGPAGGPAQQVYLVEVDPRQIADQAERDRVMSAPTTLALDPPLARRIVAAGARLLGESPEFQRLMRDLGEAPQP